MSVVRHLILQGRHGEARALFERLLGLRNDVGLLAEEYNPAASHKPLPTGRAICQAVPVEGTDRAAAIPWCRRYSAGASRASAATEDEGFAGSGGAKRRNRSALKSTLTLESAMASPAKMGESKMPKAG